MRDFDTTLLKEGDALLYWEPTLVDWLISIKTGYWIAHIEIYAGRGTSVASRNGIGVNRYALRLGGLMSVRRPQGILDLETAEKRFQSDWRGQGYDFKGLLCFYLAVKHGSAKKMFCSEFALRFYRAASIQPFNPDMDADRTAPCEFWKTHEFDTIWQKKGFEP